MKNKCTKNNLTSEFLIKKYCKASDFKIFNNLRLKSATIKRFKLPQNWTFLHYTSLFVSRFTPFA